MKTCSWITDTEEPCGEICEGRTEFCATHNRQKRKEQSDLLKEFGKRNTLIAKQRAKNQVPRAKISKVSPKREEINKEYFKLVEQFKHDNPHCKAKVNVHCTGTTDDAHHSRGRDKFLLDVTTWIPVCRSCHIWIGDNHKEAEAKGLVFSRLATTEPHKL